MLFASAARLMCSYVMLTSGRPISSWARMQPQFMHMKFLLCRVRHAALGHVFEPSQVVFDHLLRVLQRPRGRLSDGARRRVVPLHHDVDFGLATAKLRKGHVARNADFAMAFDRAPTDRLAWLVLRHIGVKLDLFAERARNLPVRSTAITTHHANFVDVFHERWKALEIAPELVGFRGG